MTTAPGTAPPAFRHEAFLYRTDEDFLAGVGEFVRDGLADGDVTVVAEPADRLGLLREALGQDAAEIRFLDMAEIGGNPARILGVWAEALDEATARGRRLRGVGEPAFAGRRAVELDECHLHESLLNAAFDPGPAWRLMCPYDAGRLPGPVRERALHSHPEWSTATDRGTTEADVAAAVDAAFSAPLSPPAGAVLRGPFGAGDVPAVRRTVATWARSCGLAAEQVDVLALAASELATNAVTHGGGRGVLSLWDEPGAVILEVHDSGRLADPLAGRLRPPPRQEGGAGLYLVNQLADLTQLRSGPDGTTVRVTTWR